MREPQRSRLKEACMNWDNSCALLKQRPIAAALLILPQPAASPLPKAVAPASPCRPPTPR